MLFVLEWVIGIDQDVVDVSGAKVIDVVKQDGVNEALKGGRSVAKAKRHNSILVGAVARAEGGEIFNVLLESDAVEGVMDIELHEDAGLG